MYFPGTRMDVRSIVFITTTVAVLAAYGLSVSPWFRHGLSNRNNLRLASVIPLTLALLELTRLVLDGKAVALIVILPCLTVVLILWIRSTRV